MEMHARSSGQASGMEPAVTGKYLSTLDEREAIALFVHSTNGYMTGRPMLLVIIAITP